MVSVDTTLKDRNRRRLQRTRKPSRGRKPHAAQSREGATRASSEKLEKSYGVTTPRHPAGNETRKVQKRKRYKARRKCREIPQDLGTRPLPKFSLAAQVARRAILRDFWGKVPRRNYSSPKQLQHAGSLHAEKATPRPRPPRAARKAILGR